MPVSPARCSSLENFRRSKCKNTASANSFQRKKRELSIPPGTRQEYWPQVPWGDVALSPASPNCSAAPTEVTANISKAEQAQDQPSPLQTPGGISHMQHTPLISTEREVLGKHTSKSPLHPRMLLPCAWVPAATSLSEHFVVAQCFAMIIYYF